MLLTNHTSVLKVVSKCTDGKAQARALRSFLCGMAAFLVTTISVAQDLATTALKKLSIEELMDVEVTSVSRRPEKLAEAASAIQVITQADIHRSGATSIPEALRLSPNLQVAQLNSHHWIISARGFNSTFANKLLVMIDGRTLYSPLFAGVFWDVQNLLLEDVDRIEIISGPGGTLWGANAVNGVINIITKKAKDTQGVYASATVGSSLQDLFEARYGGNVGSKFSYRVYALHRDHRPTVLADGNDNIDKWRLSQAGFIADWHSSDVNTLTVQGNFYTGLIRTSPDASTVDGQNILSRWVHRFSEKSELIVQGYFDRTWRHDVASTFDDELETFDLDIQHRFSPGSRHTMVYGAGYRFMHNEVQSSTGFVGFFPQDRDMDLFSTFIQDEIAFVPDRLKLTVGMKLQHNVFSRFEFQPNARLNWTLKQHTLWGAVSRAVRAPSRIDVDYHIPALPVPPEQPSVAGGPNFDSEKMIAYEVGYRIQPASKLSLSLAAFYNTYDDLYSVEQLPGTLTFQIQNGAKGTSHGIEFAGNYQVLSNWRVRGGYTYFSKSLENKKSNITPPIALTNLGSDAQNIALLQSILDLPAHLQLDVTTRYVDKLPVSQFNPAVPSYFSMDLRMAWKSQNFEVSVVGQNLLADRHTEYATIQIPRSVYGKVAWRFQNN